MIEIPKYVFALIVIITSSFIGSMIAIPILEMLINPKKSEKKRIKK